jgi:hypothetical protein
MSLRSAITTDAQVRLDRVDADEIAKNPAGKAIRGASNSASAVKSIGHGQFGDQLVWMLAAHLGMCVHQTFLRFQERSEGNKGNLELGPPTEDEAAALSIADRVKRSLAALPGANIQTTPSPANEGARKCLRTTLFIASRQSAPELVSKEIE